MRDISIETSQSINSITISMIETTLSDFITKNFILGADENIASDVSLVASGVMDSTSALELAEFLETTYAIKVSDRDINPENFETIGSIARFVASKVRAGD